MRLSLSIIAVAINIIVFATMGALLMADNTKKSNPFLILLVIGCILNTYLIVTAY